MDFDILVHRLYKIAHLEKYPISNQIRLLAFDVAKNGLTGLINYTDNPDGVDYNELIKILNYYLLHQLTYDGRQEIKSLLFALKTEGVDGYLKENAA